MTFKTLTMTFPILLDHVKISFREHTPLQKYSRTLTLVFHVYPKLKTTCVMGNLYVPSKSTYMTNQLY